MDLRRKKLEKASNVNFNNLQDGDVLVYDSATKKWVNALVGGTVTIIAANYSALPIPSSVTGKFYWCQSSQGTKWLPGSLGGTYYPAGLYHSNGTTWEFMDSPINATQSEVNTGLDQEKFVTPYTLANATKFNSYLDKTTYDSDNDGVVDSSEREQIQVINKTGATLTKGTIVYIKSTSSSTNYPEVLKANANSEATSSKTIGAIYEDILDSAVGYIITSGQVHNLNTSSYNVGDKLWLSTTDGLVTTTIPAEPNHSVFIGHVTRSQVSNGRILYAIQNGYELDELHGVNVSSPSNNDVLYFESSSGLWKNKQILTNIIGTAILNFGNEEDASVVTVANVDITPSNFRLITFVPQETVETSLDDFKLNGVSFNIENIISNTSFDIRGTALNGASGNYTVNYYITRS